MTIRLTGMSSGLDTESMISELMSAYNTTKQKKVSTMTKYSWKMDAWSSLNSKVVSFYNKSLSNMRFSTSYNSKKTTVSDTTKASVVASGTATIGSQSLAIKQLAQSGYLTGGVMSKTDGTKATTGTTLSDLGYTGDETSFTIKSGTGEKTITVNGDSKISDIVAKIADAGVNATFDANNQRIFISAKESGKDSDFDLSADNSNAISAMTALGIFSGSDATEDSEYAKWASYGATKTKNADGTYTYTLQDKDTFIANNSDLITAEVDKRTASYEKTITAAQDAIDAAQKKKDDAQNLIDGYDKTVTDEEGNETTEHVKGYQESLNENSAYTSAKATAETLAQAIEDGTISDEDKTKYGITDDTDPEDIESLTDSVLSANKKDATGDDLTAINEAIALRKKVKSSESTIKSAQETIDKNNDTIDTYTDKLSTVQEDTEDDLYEKVKSSVDVMNGESSGSGSAVRIFGQNAEIYLNGAYFESTKNSFEINGLTITASEVTGVKDDSKSKSADELTASDYNTVTLTTGADVDGIYKNIKNFISSYNELIKEMDTLYNADSASDYDVLTDDEKDAMSDTEVEAWEKKIKDSLLRRDDTLDSVINTLKNAMGKSYTINGTKYSLSSFGIDTLSYFNAADNEKGVYHIDGDSDDADTSSETDKLRAAISNDPDGVYQYFSNLAKDMYSDLQKKMRSTTLSSSNSIYNDKQMTTQYSTYKTELSDYEDKLADIEDKYYKQFSNMETALSKLESSSSSVTSLLG